MFTMCAVLIEFIGIKLVDANQVPESINLTQHFENTSLYLIRKFCRAGYDIFLPNNSRNFSEIFSKIFKNNSENCDNNSRTS